ncbi:hypothetical protein FACS189449_12040 [Alphaproteobacteria bacterium]|nr:hypothetical protein FACS189449_12040 [Alphaproteobacteria bacterium]
MKIILFCLSCILLLIGCESEKISQEEYILSETKMTEDMQKIKALYVNRLRKNLRGSFEEGLEIAKVICKFYKKNNKQLDKELKKIHDKHHTILDEEKSQDAYFEYFRTFKTALKGLKLDCDQVLTLAREIERALSEVVADQKKIHDPYMAKAKEILKNIRAKADVKDDWYNKHEWIIRYAVDDGDFDGYMSADYGTLPCELFARIREGILKDSFLEKCAAQIDKKNEYWLGVDQALGFSSSALGIIDEKIRVFDPVRNAAKNTAIKREELEKIVEFAAGYLHSFASNAAGTHVSVVDEINCRSLDEQYKNEKMKTSFHRYILAELMEKYPKPGDLEKQIDILSSRLAYTTYHEAKAAKILYAEWRRRYLSQMDEFFKNSRILAERLHNICKDEKVGDTEDDKRKHKRNMEHIIDIREITSMEPKKIFPPNSPLDSLQKIKEAYSVALNRLIPSRASEPYARCIFNIDAEVNACPTITLTEAEMTEDMQKIKDIFVKDFQEETRISSEKRLKVVKVACELYGKNKGQLNKEFEKIYPHYNQPYEEYRKHLDALNAALKGLKLDCNQVPQLTKEIEKAQSEIVTNDNKLYAPYKAKAKEILKEDVQYSCGYRLINGISGVYGQLMVDCLNYVMDDHSYDELSSYDHISSRLFRYIDDGTLRDSFLEKTASPLEEEDEYLLRHSRPMFSMLNIEIDTEGVVLFDRIRNAAKNTAMKRKELEEVVWRAAVYLSNVASDAIDIQSNIVDELDHVTSSEQRRKSTGKRPYFYSSDRYLLLGLAEKYPKFEDFEKQIDVLSARLAYSAYHKAVAARFLYAEWRRRYLSQMDELFKNARILAERLHNICKDEKVSDDDKYQHEKNVENIATIREVTSRGRKILSTPCAPLSLQNIKTAYKNRFMKMRESYLRHMEREVK